MKHIQEYADSKYLTLFLINKSTTQCTCYVLSCIDVTHQIQYSSKESCDLEYVLVHMSTLKMCPFGNLC